MSATHPIGDVAALCGLSVRALRHYDELGLLVPSLRTAAGYRLYTNDDLLRLQQIMIGRELGLSLAQIQAALDDPAHDRVAALRAQRAALVERAARTAAMLAAVDAALARLTTTTEETTMPKDLFDGFDPAAHEAEAAARWGTTPAHAEATRRTARYTDADWRVLKAEADAIMRAAADLADAGEPPGGSAAQAVVTRHRAHLDRWFYPCDTQMHAQLADLYEVDPRFAATIDAYRAGLTGWLVAAIRVAHPEAQGA